MSQLIQKSKAKTILLLFQKLVAKNYTVINSEIGNEKLSLLIQKSTATTESFMALPSFLLGVYILLS
jgi:hypothetical protein